MAKCKNRCSVVGKFLSEVVREFDDGRGWACDRIETRDTQSMLPGMNMQRHHIRDRNDYPLNMADIDL